MIIPYLPLELAVMLLADTENPRRIEVRDITNISWTLAEQARGNALRVDILDHSREILDLLGAVVDENDGLVPVEEPRSPTSQSGANATSINGLEGNAGIVASFFAERGLSVGAIAAILGSMQQESNINPNAENSIGAYGVCQWLDSRRTGLETHAAGLGLEPNDINAQLSWMWYEFTEDPFESQFGAQVIAAQDVNAGIAGMDAYLRYGPGEEGNRRQYANEWLAKLQNGSVPTENDEEAAAPPMPTSPSSSRTVEYAVGQQITLLPEPGIAIPFIHTALSHDVESGVTSVEGQSAAWVLTRVQENSSYENITSREVIESLAEKYGLRVEWRENEDGEEYDHYTISNETAYDVIVEEAQSLGYDVSVEDDLLIVSRRNVEDFDVTLVRGENVSSFRISHRATTSGGEEGVRTSDAIEERIDAIRSTKIDALSGEVVAQGEESETKDVGTPEQKKRPPRRNAEAANQRRVRGIRLEAELVPTDTSFFRITPNSAVVSDGFGNFSDRAWIVESVRHEVSSGGHVISLSLYSPQTAKYSSASPSGEATGEVVAEGSWACPMNAPVTVVRCNTPTHAGVDLVSTINDDIFAMRSGVVASTLSLCSVGDALCGGGYGNYVVIDHGDGFFTRYAHLAQVYVASGERVTQGQRIGLMGNTGRSTGPHLHAEIRRGGAFGEVLQICSLVSCLQ